MDLPHYTGPVTFRTERVGCGIVICRDVRAYLAVGGYFRNIPRYPLATSRDVTGPLTTMHHGLHI
eukprot:scaffold421299_cov72-Attheya_sp.AAC.1